MPSHQPTLLSLGRLELFFKRYAGACPQVSVQRRIRVMDKGAAASRCCLVESTRWKRRRIWMKRSTISVTGPAEAQGVPWQFWPEHLCDLSGAEIAIGGLKVPGDYFLLSSDTSGDGGGSALDDVSAHAASDLTPIELAGGANPTVSFNTQTCSAEIGGSGQPELRAEEGLSGCPASDVALDLAVSPENGGIAVLTVASPPALFFAAGPSGTYQSTPIAAPIPAQDPHGTSFGRFDAATAYDADIQVPTGIAAHHAQNSGPGPMDGGGAPGVLTIPANPVADSSAPIADSAVGPGGATAAQVQQALDESGLSVNGSGIKVGVLSDSFNDLGGAAADEADGALPSSCQCRRDQRPRFGRHRRGARDDADHPRYRPRRQSRVLHRL